MGGHLWMLKEKIESTDLCLMSVPSSAVDPISFGQMVLWIRLANNQLTSGCCPQFSSKHLLWPKSSHFSHLSFSASEKDKKYFFLSLTLHKDAALGNFICVYICIYIWCVHYWWAQKAETVRDTSSLIKLWYLWVNYPIEAILLFFLFCSLVFLSCSLLHLIPMCIWIYLHCPTSCCHLGMGREKAKFMAHVTTLKLPTRFCWLLQSAWSWDHPVNLAGFGVAVPAALLTWWGREMEPLYVLKNLDIAVIIWEGCLRLVKICIHAGTIISDLWKRMEIFLLFFF